MLEPAIPIVLVSVDEAARILGVSTSWLNNQRVRGGGCPYLKLGRRVMYDPREIECWFKKQRRTSTSEY